MVEECQAPVLLLCSSRRELLEEHPEWDEGRDRFSTLTVEPLGADESARVMQNLLGAIDLDATIVERVTVAADGNPLYLEQMLQMLMDQGAIRHEGGRWITTEALSNVEIPPTIAALLTARLDRLGQSERTVIERSAVIGQVFYRGAIEALVPPPVQPEVAPCLKTLTIKELIGPHEGTLIGEEAFKFLHALIRDAAYSGLLKRTRAELHVAFVDWVESAAGDRILEYEEIRGFHLEQAYEIRSGLGVQDEDVVTLGRRAASYLSSAGRRALNRGDLPAADNLLRRAAATLPHGDPFAVELLVEAGEALVDLGELAQADEVLGSAIDQATARGDEIAALGARIVRMRLHYETEGEDSDGTLLQSVEDAVGEFEAVGDHMGLIRASHLLLLMHWTAGRHGAAEQAALKTIEHARAVGDRTREIRILPALATCSTYGPTPVDEAAALCAHLLEEVGGDQKADALIRASLARLEAMRGNFEEARQLYRRSRATLEEFGWNLFAALTSIDSGTVELMARDPVAAEGELRRDFETLDAMGERNYIATTSAYLAFALLLQGKYDEADRYITFSEETAAPDDLTSQFLWRQFRARLLSIHDKHDEAHPAGASGRGADRRDRGNRITGQLATWTLRTSTGGQGRRNRPRRPSSKRRNGSDAKVSRCWSRTFSGVSTPSTRNDDLAAHPRAMPVRERGMEHAPELECSGTPERPMFDVAGRQVLVERPVPPVGGHRVGPADATPLDDVARRDAHRGRRPMGHDGPNRLRGSGGRVATRGDRTGGGGHGHDQERGQDERRAANATCGHAGTPPSALGVCGYYGGIGRRIALSAHDVTRTLPHIPVHVVPINVE